MDTLTHGQVLARTKDLTDLNTLSSVDDRRHAGAAALRDGELPAGSVARSFLLKGASVPAAIRHPAGELTSAADGRG
jgi:hypothetical protein